MHVGDPLGQPLIVLSEPPDARRFGDGARDDPPPGQQHEALLRLRESHHRHVDAPRHRASTGSSPGSPSTQASAPVFPVAACTALVRSPTRARSCSLAVGTRNAKWGPRRSTAAWIFVSLVRWWQSSPARSPLAAQRCAGDDRGGRVGRSSLLRAAAPTDRGPTPRRCRPRSRVALAGAPPPRAGRFPAARARARRSARSSARRCPPPADRAAGAAPPWSLGDDRPSSSVTSLEEILRDAWSEGYDCPHVQETL